MPQRKGASKTTNTVGGTGMSASFAGAKWVASKTGAAMDFIESKIWPQDPEHPYEPVSKRDPALTGMVTGATLVATVPVLYKAYRTVKDWTKKDKDVSKALATVLDKKMKDERSSQGSYTPVNQSSSSQFTTVSPSDVDRKNDVYNHYGPGGFMSNVVIA